MTKTKTETETAQHTPGEMQVRVGGRLAELALAYIQCSAAVLTINGPQPRNAVAFVLAEYGESALDPNCEAGANAARLARCWNTHPALLGALREASRALTELDPLAKHHDAILIDDALAQARA